MCIARFALQVSQDRIGQDSIARNREGRSMDREHDVSIPHPKHDAFGLRSRKKEAASAKMRSPKQVDCGFAAVQRIRLGSASMTMFRIDADFFHQPHRRRIPS
ncbi:MAG: hypothetical protein B7Z78_09900 [Rhodospirillales bacterium 20-60-12]|nr:MAG: hypothetical protein B7Z78_09900 [Rhodospirillales bacterium 20-60-12]